MSPRSLDLLVRTRGSFGELSFDVGLDKLLSISLLENFISSDIILLIFNPVFLLLTLAADLALRVYSLGD